MCDNLESSYVLFQNHTSVIEVLREAHQSEISKLQSELNKLQTLQEQTDSARAEKRCGSCNLPVMSCEHELFVPTVEWQQSQQELEQQIHSLQKVWVDIIYQQ